MLYGVRRGPVFSGLYIFINNSNFPHCSNTLTLKKGTNPHLSIIELLKTITQQAKG